MQTQEDQGLQDLPELFHKSSIRNRQILPLPLVAKETWQCKKWRDHDNQDYINEYRIDAEVGAGAFGRVYRVVKDGKYFAMKQYSKCNLRKQRFFAADGEFTSSLQMLQNELIIVKRLQHKNLATCLETIEAQDVVYMISELGDLGQLMLWSEVQGGYVRNQKIVQYLQLRYGTDHVGDLTRIIFLQVCEAVSYLHRNNITNRDIKVDNIVCASWEEIGQEIKVIDFTTVRYSEDDISYFPTGTAGFRGPETQFASDEGYSCKMGDVWSIGICMYVFLCEQFPFNAESDLEIDIRAKNQPLKYPPNVSPLLIDVIEKMTRKDWKERVSVDQAWQLLRGE